MKKDQQLEPVSVYYQISEPQISNLMKHNFYEFVYFNSGKGKHFNKGVSNNFFAGELFFIRPDEEHAFEITEQSEVYILRFTENAKLVIKDLVENSSGRAVKLAKAQSPLNPKVTFNSDDKKLVLKLFELLKQLYENPIKNENLCYFQILCLISIIERNLQYSNEDKGKLVAKKDIVLMLHHIHKFLKYPEMLSLNYIATKFNISTNLLGVYFKKEIGQSVKQYINKCRLEIIGEMVAKSNFTFSEIAYQYGYVDESHFHKSFKKYYGMSPSEYRNKLS